MGIISFSIIFCCIFACFSTSATVSAAVIDSADTLNADAAFWHNTCDEILSWKFAQCSTKNLQDFINGYCCENPLNGNVQTFIQSLVVNPYYNPDFSSYAKSLSTALNSQTAADSSLSPASLQKSIITLNLCGDLSELSDDTLDFILNHTIGERGIMSYSYGLKMLYTCNLSSSVYSEAEITDILISMQLEDGGYSLEGDAGDVDVTAMTVQALAPYYSTDARVKDSVDKALSFLSSAQLPDGDFASYGNACSESTAQVIIALCSLDLNPFEYSSFIRNNNTCLSGIIRYQTDEGGFSHTFGSKVNDMASAQSFEAISRALSFICDDSIISTDNSHIKKHVSIKTVITIVIACIFVLLSLTTAIILKNNRKKLLSLLLSYLLITLFALAAVWFINIQSKSAYETGESKIIYETPNNETICVTFAITCNAIDSEDVYSPQVLYVKKDTTVFELLCEVCRTGNIQLDYEGNSVYGMAYIKSINSIYEFDHGDLSGWMYRVNGDFPSVGCGYYTLSDGDTVEWCYTTNLGKDLE